jgi:hypothetical protein
MLLNTYPFDNLDEASASRFLFWGSFDGTTNDPVVYPVGSIDLAEIERQVLGSDSVGNPWGAPPGTVIDPGAGGGDGGAGGGAVGGGGG